MLDAKIGSWPEGYTLNGRTESPPASLHFAFTITYHYLFPQLTMGLALLIVILKTLAWKTGDEKYDISSRFWAKIFTVNFFLGVVTSIPMEFSSVRTGRSFRTGRAA